MDSFQCKECLVIVCFVSLTDEKLNDQYVVQRPCTRASRRKDEFIWYDKTSGKFSCGGGAFIT